jgi:uncharacterized membrane protein YukC
MSTTINGKADYEILLEKLNQTIKENNDITAKQNTLMVRYTKWLVWLTIIIGIATIIQLIKIFGR